MNSILSFFDTAVADYLLMASITAAILVAVAWGLVKTRRVESPANRHMIWLFSLVAIVILPAIWLHGPKLRLTVLPADSSPALTALQSDNIDFTAGPAISMVETGAAASVDLPAESKTPEADASPSLRFPPMMTLLSFGWGIGFLLMLIRLTFGGIKLRGLLQTAVPVADAMGLDNGGRRRIDLLISSKVDSPVCFGLLRPVILMPTKMYDETSREDLRMILRHELAHIERRDCWINLFQRLVEAVLFFHPLVWYASFQLTQEREELCDQHVIAGGASPENYVELLSRIARQGFEKRTLQAVALFEGRLLSRVQSLLGLGGRLQIRASRRAIGILAAAAMLCLAVGTVRLEAGTGTSAATDTPEETVSFRPQEETLGGNNSRPVGDCSISGRVVSAVTGEPVGDAMVYLFYVGTHDPIFIKVASDGTFSFEDIPGGKYALQVINTDGFQDATYDLENNTQNNGMGTIFSSLPEGEKKSDVLFQLEPLPEYSISGRILGEDGAPVTESGLVVKALKKGEATECTPALYNEIGAGQVEADGSYHLDALSGEPVLVMAEAPSFFVEGEHSFPPCYYPGTISRGKATWVDFDGAISRENIDIQLVATDGVVLEGRVVDEETGAPVPNTIVAVDRPDMLIVYVSTLTDETGYYRFENIGAEELLVHFDARTSGYVRQRMPVAMAAGETVRLDAGLKKAAEISGIFLDEKGAPFVVSENAYGYTNTIDPDDPSKNQVTLSIGVSSSTETEDGRIEKRSETLFVNGEGDYPSGDWRSPTQDSFLVEAVLPGETTLKFFPKEQGVEVKKIVYNGEDILELEEMPMESESVATATFETRPGETIEDIAIVLGPVVNSPSP